MFRVIDTQTHEKLPGIPTPRLIEAGGGDAFEKDGVWYIREDGTMHVSPTGEYTRVTIQQTDSWRVDMTIAVRDESVHDDDLPEEYRDHFIVEAASRQEAEDLAAEAAREDVTERFGEDCAALINFLDAKKGVSI